MTDPVTIPSNLQALVDELIEFANGLEGGITARSNFEQIARKARNLTGPLGTCRNEVRETLEQFGHYGSGAEYFSAEIIEFAYVCQDYETERDLNVAIPLITLALNQLGAQPESLPLPAGAHKCIFCPKPAVTIDGQCTSCSTLTLGRELEANREFASNMGPDYRGGPLFPH